MPSMAFLTLDAIKWLNFLIIVNTRLEKNLITNAFVIQLLRVSHNISRMSSSQQARRPGWSEQRQEKMAETMIKANRVWRLLLSFRGSRD